MSDYQQYIAEREKIDFYLNKGFEIKNVEENLEGAFLYLEKSNGEEESPQEETLHIKHADSRKYFASILIKQLRQNN